MPIEQTSPDYTQKWLAFTGIASEFNIAAMGDEHLFPGIMCIGDHHGASW